MGNGPRGDQKKGQTRQAISWIKGFREPARLCGLWGVLRAEGLAFHRQVPQRSMAM